MDVLPTSLWRTTLLSTALLLAGAAGAWRLTEGFRVWTAQDAFRISIARKPILVPPLTLLEAQNQKTSLQQLLRTDQRISLLDLIYTRCPGVCSTLGSTFAQLQQRLREAGESRVQLLSISFDPANDGPQQLARYGRMLGARSAYWRFFVPSDPQQLPAFLRALDVMVIPDGFGGYQHNAGLLVLDAQGRLVRVFDNSEAELALAYARDLADGNGHP